jgi:hypothetical protein
LRSRDRRAALGGNPFAAAELVTGFSQSRGYNVSKLWTGGTLEIGFSMVDRESAQASGYSLAVDVHQGDGNSIFDNWKAYLATA